MPQSSSRPEASPRSTEGRLVYAVGDVHGHVALLEALLIEIARDAVDTAPPQRPMLIFLGDYVDRGAASAEVVDLILALRKAPVFEVRTLKGNHEAAFLAFLADPMFGGTWVQFGGAATLRSYGVRVPREFPAGTAWARAQQELRDALPTSHLDFLTSLELLIQVGDYVFAHAGVDPRAPLVRQVERDLLWIRDEFLNATPKARPVVVHGHTPAPAAEFRRHRIGVDTGAYVTGLLTALRLFDGAESVIQAQVERAAPADQRTPPTVIVEAMRNGSPP